MKIINMKPTYEGIPKNKKGPNSLIAQSKNNLVS